MLRIFDFSGWTSKFFSHEDGCFAPDLDRMSSLYELLLQEEEECSLPELLLREEEECSLYELLLQEEGRSSLYELVW